MKMCTSIWKISYENVHTLKFCVSLNPATPCASTCNLEAFGWKGVCYQFQFFQKDLIRDHFMKEISLGNPYPGPFSDLIWDPTDSRYLALCIHMSISRSVSFIYDSTCIYVYSKPTKGPVAYGRPLQRGWRRLRLELRLQAFATGAQRL